MERENRGDRDPYRGPNGESYVTRWGKGRARSPPRVPSPTPEPVRRPSRQPLCDEQGDCVSRRPDNPFSSVGIDDINSHCLCFLPFCNLMMVVSVCKQFSEWQKTPFFDFIAKECLCVSFPMMDRRFLPSLGYTIYRKLYVDFFYDRSTESLLFSKCGYQVLKEWMRSVFPRSRQSNQNLPLNLSVLRKGGFFCSLYSRMRTAAILREEIKDGTVSVFLLFTQCHYLTVEERNGKAVRLLCRIARLEFILNLLQHAYSVERLQIHSNSWRRESMHLLEDTDPRWHIDICRRYVDDLNKRFAEVARNPSLDNIRVIFTNLRNDNYDVVAMFMEIMRCGCTWVNSHTKTAGLFSSFFFDMEPQFMPLAWHNSMYIQLYEEEIDTASEYDHFWTSSMELLSRSRDWGVMVPRPAFVTSRGIIHVDLFFLELGGFSFEVRAQIRDSPPSSGESSP